MKPPVISPTQVSTWRSCHRKFAFTYLGNLPRPEPTKAQRVGVAVHGRVERFFQTGVPDYGGTLESPEEAEGARLLAQVVDHLPFGAQSEQKVEVELGGVLFGGRFDWLHVGEFSLLGIPDHVELGDLKTTSNLKYAKTRAELSIDPQALIYSYGQEAQTGFPPERVDLRWVYVQTKGKPDVREVTARVDPSALDALIIDGRAIVRAWEAKIEKGPLDPNAFEPNTSSCDAYGGCPFRGQCKLDPAERLANLQKRMGLLSTSETGEQIMGQQQTFEEMMAAANGIADEPVAVNPPVAPAALAAAVATVTANVTRTEEKEAPAPVATTVVVNVTPAAEAPKAKRRNARVLESSTGSVPSQLVPQVKPIGVLYVSCLPFPPEADVDLADLIVADASVEMAEKLGVSDYRLIDFKGAGVLTEAVVERVKALRPRALYVDGHSPTGRILAGPLMALADKTIQGI